MRSIILETLALSSILLLIRHDVIEDLLIINHVLVSVKPIEPLTKLNPSCPTNKLNDRPKWHSLSLLKSYMDPYPRKRGPYEQTQVSLTNELTYRLTL